MKSHQTNVRGLQLLKLKQVMSITSLGRSTVYKYCADNNFPKPIKLGQRNVAWIENEVQEWIKQKMIQRAVTR